MFGEDELTLVLEPGRIRQTKTGQRHEPGRIIIYGLREPWPDPAEFRHALDSAFREAAEVEAEQMQRANSLVAHLRAGLRSDR
jgi:hypothetical protein